MSIARAAVLAGLASILLAGQAAAQVDLSGAWVQRTHEDWQEEGDGPDLGDLLGLPVNEEARARALSYSGSSLALPERQCLFYAPNYIVGGYFGINILPETDPRTGEVKAWILGPVVDRGEVKVWMDGRTAPPPEAPRDVGGFASGEWVGNTLKVRVTNARQGYIRRNGAPSSDKAVFTMHITRHADTLTIVGIVEDPIYLSEPLVRSRVYVRDPNAVPHRVGGPCTPTAEVASLDGTGAVPHVLPGENTAPADFARIYGLPRETVLGGAQTMYPEYRRQLRGVYRRPEECERYCCGWEVAGRQALPLGCIITASP